MPVRLFVGNLPYNATEAELREHFSEVGQISYLSLPTDRETGQPRGFAFVEFNDQAQAEEAIRRFNNQLFKGRPIAVNEARARDSSPRPSITSRPLVSRPLSTAEPNATSPPSSGSKSSRNFGPDASPQRSRSKAKGGPKSERAIKGPMREVVRGQFFGDDDDEGDDEESSEENSASLLSDTESEDDI